MTKPSLDETLIEVWRQTLVENDNSVNVGGESYPVRWTPKRGLRQVDFIFDGTEIRGLEQNPETKSRWAQLARSGRKVMQFVSEGRYLAMERSLATAEHGDSQPNFFETDSSARYLFNWAPLIA
jgi:hypothetical protein